MITYIDTIILHLSLINGIGPATILSLFEHMPQDFELADMYTLSVAQWKQLFGVSLSTAQKLVTGLQDKRILEEELALIAEKQVSWVTFKNNVYPSLLKEIHCPPPILYWYGTMPKAQNTVAIIGARKANEYARNAINSFVTDLVAHNFIIVSGGAIGADSMAHEQTVRVGGKTIAVLGSGLLHPYPASNRKLFNSIIKTGGTVLSIFPMDTLPQKGNFPTRNRVIAGLSRGCIVAQAAEKSGARITAQFALEQGRDVFAIPGSITDPLSAGCHALIKEGAIITSSVKDVLSEWGYETVDTKNQQSVISHTNVKTQKEEIKKEVVVEDTYSSQERQLLHVCATPISFDDIIRRTGLSSGVLQAQLFQLQIAGALEQDFTGMWVTK